MMWRALSISPYLYLTSAFLPALISTTAACSWFSSYAGAVHPSRYGRADITRRVIGCYLTGMA